MKAHIYATAPGADGKKEAAGLRLTNLPGSGRQLINIDTLERHKDFVTVADGKITYNTLDGEVVFTIVREPGRYCLTCGERLPDHGGNGTQLEAMRAKECREHVDTHGKDAIRDDNGAGHVNRPRTFECTFEDQRT